MDGTEEGFLWMEAMGIIVIAVTVSEVGIDVKDDDIERHGVWVSEVIVSPKSIHSYKNGRHPTVPKQWFLDGEPLVPLNHRYGVVDRAV